MSTKSCPTISSDFLMETTYYSLHQDLSQHVDQEPASNVVGSRSVDYRPPKYANPYNVKCRAQLTSWLKRYRFANDLYTDEQLEQLTNEKFLADQYRIGSFRPLSFRAALVLQRARVFIKGVLGPYNDENIFPYCRFSRNATVGFRGKEVYLDQKIFPGSRLTGTRAECKWFTNYLLRDALLRRSLQKEERISPSLIRRRILYDIVDSLKQVNVPKTAKILRPVRPNTLIGSFRSIGIGEYIKVLIKENLGINLNFLQEHHRRLAKRASRTLDLVTADLSSASDSFTSSLLNRLLPRDWYAALGLGRTPYVEVGDRQIWSPSFMAMGIGYTFPVMTLCFFAILRAIQELSGTKGIVSVFGDDLIYPSKIHHYVVGVFNDINFRINLDKTFTLEPFRESCGGDYYEGIDVRPARPEGVSQVLEGHAIAAYVYKLFNSLIRRWEEVELPSTFAFLRAMLDISGADILSVPTDFPDESGLKDGNWRSHALAEHEKTRPNLRKPFYQGLLIPCLQQVSRLRPVGYQAIFLWESLHGDDFRVPNPFEPQGNETLIWRSVKDRAVGKRYGNSRGYRKLVAFQTKRGTRFFQPALTPYNR